MVLADANSNLEQFMLGICRTVSCMVKEWLHLGIQVPYQSTACSIIQPMSGEIRLQDGFHYKGDFFKNSLEGHGHITFPDDSEYEGAVVDGLRHGQGHFTQGSITYTGGWKCGVRHGTGIMRYSQTSFYDGQFVDGKGNLSGIIPIYKLFTISYREWIRTEAMG